jgi:hypothetical protein
MRPVTAPAAHMVTIKAARGGVVVGHLGCSAPEVFVSNRHGEDYVLSIDTIQAVVNHKCPAGGDAADSDPSEWVTP